MNCRSLFEERATLPELKGPQYDAFKKGLKITLKVLKNMGHPLNKQDLTELQHQSNRSMFSIIKEDYIKTEIFLESQPKAVHLLQQKRNYLAILNRLMKETSINEELTPKLMQDLHFLNDVTINEAA